MPRVAILLLAMLFIFGAVAGILVKVMPAPLKDSDYFMIGSVATLAALGVLFLIVVTTSRKASTDVLFRKRKKNS
ncbi:MAG: hypothetical protein ABL995_14470 [Bryobacteraceae bacterium]